MKYLTVLFSLIFLLSACQQEEEGLPSDLGELRALLKEKRDASRELGKEIAEIEAIIEKQDPNAKKKRTLVTTQLLKRKTFDHFVEIQGTVTSDDLVTASSDVGGRIIDLKVEEGQNIQKGQLIARLDLEQLDKQIAELQTSLELARELYDRQKRLWDQNIGSEVQFLQAKNNKERLEKSLETLEFQKNKANVYAPISGVVENKFLKVGELAGPGTPIIQILNTSKVKVVADVPENYIQSIRKGESVTIQFPALDKEQKARIALVGRTIDPSNRTFTVEVDLNNKGGLLKPNLLANVMFNDYSQKDAVVIPLELVQQEVGGKSYVFVKTDGEEGPVAKKMYVKTGESYKGEVVIAKGLTGEEEIIIDGARNLSANELITIQKG
jgi:membrane fusion protein (multidrug efflux system)